MTTPSDVNSARWAALHFENWRMGDVVHAETPPPNWLMLIGNPPFHVDGTQEQEPNDDDTK